MRVGWDPFTSTYWVKSVWHNLSNKDIWSALYLKHDIKQLFYPEDKCIPIKGIVIYSLYMGIPTP